MGHESFSAKPRRCLIIGATGGIGEAVADTLLTSGHSIALGGRNRIALQSAADRMTICPPVFEFDFDNVVRLVDAHRNQVGSVEILVLAMGVASSAKAVNEEDRVWSDTIDVNLTLPQRLIRATLPDMLANKWGRIVAIGSTVALRGAPYVSTYAASKHALMGYVKSVATEIGPQGVTINAICPGYVDTKMTNHTIDQISRRTKKTPQSARTILEHQQGHRRLITPNEIAQAVEFAIHAASLNGQSIVLDGGIS